MDGINKSILMLVMRQSDIIERIAEKAGLDETSLGTLRHVQKDMHMLYKRLGG